MSALQSPGLQKGLGSHTSPDLTDAADTACPVGPGQLYFTPILVFGDNFIVLGSPACWRTATEASIFINGLF